MTKGALFKGRSGNLTLGFTKSQRLAAVYARFQPVFYALLFALIFFLGVWGWRLSVPGVSFADSAYGALGLFVIGAVPKSSLALPLEIARFLAPAMTAGFVVKVFQTLRDQRPVYQASRSKGHVLILGDGAIFTTVARRYASPAQNVIIVCQMSMEAVRALSRGRLISLDGVDDLVLERLVQRANQIIIVSPTDTGTTAWAMRLRRLQGSARVPTYLILQSPDLADSWRREEYEHIVVLPTRIATAVLRKIPPLPSDAVALPPIIIGQGDIASALLRRVVTAWQQPGERMTVHAAGTERTWADRAVAGLEQHVNLYWHDLPMEPVFAARLVREISKSWILPENFDSYEIVGSRVYIAYPQEALSAALAIAIAKHLDRSRVACLVEDTKMWWSGSEGELVEFVSPRTLIAEPEEITRTRSQEITDGLIEENEAWPTHEDAPLLRVTHALDLGTDGVRGVANLIADEVDGIFASSGLRVGWSRSGEKQIFVLSPAEIHALSQRILELLGAGTGDDTLQLAALELAARLPVVLARVSAHIQPIKGTDRAAPFGNIEIDLLARRSHELYREESQRQGNPTRSANAERTWEGLSDLDKRSNIAQVMEVPLRLATIGLTMVATEHPKLYIPTEHEEELGAEREHARWAHFQIRNGRKDHRFNKPWAEVDSRTQEYSRTFIRNLPRTLAEIGIELVPIPKARTPQGKWRSIEILGHPDGEIYTRKGLAWAWELTEPLNWATPRGDELRGAAGDWWVISEDGALRTIKPEVFAVAYKHLGEQRYQRVGRIRARQVENREVIKTREGTAHADPGDWVATDRSGDRWPIPREHFSLLYREGTN